MGVVTPHKTLSQDVRSPQLAIHEGNENLIILLFSVMFKKSVEGTVFKKIYLNMLTYIYKTFQISINKSRIKGYDPTY